MVLEDSRHSPDSWTFVSSFQFLTCFFERSISFLFTTLSSPTASKLFIYVLFFFQTHRNISEINLSPLSTPHSLLPFTAARMLHFMLPLSRVAVKLSKESLCSHQTPQEVSQKLHLILKFDSKLMSFDDCSIPRFLYL